MCICIFSSSPCLFSSSPWPVNNPVLAIDEDALLAQAASLARQNPVADFLSSDSFTSVAPEGVEVRLPAVRYIVGCEIVGCEIVCCEIVGGEIVGGEIDSGL